MYWDWSSLSPNVILTHIYDLWKSHKMNHLFVAMTFAYIYSKCLTIIELVRYCTKIPKNIPKYGLLMDYIPHKTSFVFFYMHCDFKRMLARDSWLHSITFQTLNNQDWVTWVWLSARIQTFQSLIFCWKLVHCWQANNADHTKSSSPLVMSINYPFQAVDFAGNFFSVCTKQSNEDAGTFTLVLWMYLLQRGTYFPARKLHELILLLFCILLSICLVAAFGKSF
jgi:hypothetical protein